MSKPFKEFKNFALDPSNVSKFYKNHNAGQRILPAQNNKNDAKHQFRIDAGEVKDGKKNIYLQINSQATATPLKNFLSKEGTHANVAVAQIDMNVPKEDQAKETDKAFGTFLEGVRKKLG
ncbi:unnamed protein product [Alternaria alternata]